MNWMIDIESKHNNSTRAKNAWFRPAGAVVFWVAKGIKLVLFNRELVQRGTSLSNLVYIALLAAGWEVLLGTILLSRRRKAWLIGFYLVQLAYLVLNVGYFRYYNTYLSIRQAVRILGEFGGLAVGGGVPMNPSIAIYLLDAPFLVLLLFQTFPILGRSRRLVLASFLAVMAVCAGYGYKYVRIIAPRDATVASSDRRRFVANFGLLPLQLSDFLSQADYEQRLSPLAFPEYAGPGRAARKSVLLIQVEALDANVLFARHDGKPIMPFLVSLADRGRYYPHMMSYHLGGGTSDAEFTALTSLQPLSDYAAFNLPDYRYPNSMPKSFRDAGYRVEAFHGNVGRYWNRRSVFTAMGFDEYWSLDKAGYPESGWGAKDDDVFDFVAGRMDQSSVPFFFLVLTMSSHGPYRNAPQYHVDSRFDDMPAGIERNYLLSMSYVDAALQRFFEHMGDRLDNTIVVIYGDHSEYYVPGDEYTFPRSAVRDGSRRLEFVPCVILGPGIAAGTVFDGATLADLAPTVLAASGIPYRIRSIGMNLLDGSQPRPVVPLSGHGYPRDEIARFGESTLGATKPEGR